MSRRRPQTAGVQLFPFLDVLLSAMGALILLLAVASRNLSKQEAELAADSPSAEELRVRCEMVEWELEQLRVQRDKTQADLADERLKLGHFEQHARQLRDEIYKLAAAHKQLVEPSEADDAQIAAKLRELESRIAATRHALAKALAENAGKEPSYAIIPYQGPNETRRRPIYVECRATEIVLQPEGVVLTAADMEGSLGPGNPLAAGVRAAREHLSRLRSSSAGDASEPYPLLLVRPDGIESFYAARAALESWGSEFGYELIESDWKIDYQPPDAELAAVEQDAVDTARQQQELVAQLAPRVQRNLSARSYRVAKNGGGIVAEGGDEWPPGRGFGGGRRSFGSDDGYGTAGSGFSTERSRGGPAGDDRWTTAAERATAQQGSPAGVGGYGAGGYGASSDSGANGGYGDNRYDDNSGAELIDVGPGYQGGLPGDSPADRANAMSAPYRAALESARSREALAARQRASAAGAGAGGGSSLISGGDRPGLSEGQPAADGLGGTNGGGSPNSTQSSTANAFSQSVAAGGNGSSQQSSPGATANAGNQEGPSFPNANVGQAGANGSSAPGGVRNAVGGTPQSMGSLGSSDPAVTPGLPSIGGQFGESPATQDQSPGANDNQRRRNEGPRSPFDTAGKPTGSYSQSRDGRGGSGGGGGRPSSHRGKNWALPQAGQSAVPLTRPIRVECHADRITVVPDRVRGARSRVVEFGPNTEDALNEFVSAIWDHMASWGIAGDGFYWHPIVNLQVIGDGESRAAELKTLLADSGLEIRDPKAPSKTARQAKGTGASTNR